MTTAPAPTTRLFRKLHEDGLLVLPNAWDAGSARVIERQGAAAIATTSAAVAWSHGYPDGNALPVLLLAATISEIVRVVRVPVTADIEGGYADTAAGVGQTVAAVVEAGAVGINLEDGIGDPALLCVKIAAAKGTAARLGVDLFVNARTDVVLRGLVPEENQIVETLARAERYRAAGADGIFVPGLKEVAEIRTVAAAVRLPLNVLAWPGLPTVGELEALGVRRLSAGSGIGQAVYGRIAALAAAFLAGGTAVPLAEDAMSHADVNALMGGG